ncbi:hypothetical protein ABPG77_001448 [Micractinium sp. CCAP 211/92]
MSIASAAAACPAAASCSRQTVGASSGPHAWRPWPAKPAAAGSGSSGSRGATRCQASGKSDVGRLLRDALNQPAQGTNLSYLSAANFLRGLGMDNQAELNRVLDIAMNPNSLFTSKNRKQPTNPHARRLDVEADLKPLLAFLTDTAGFSQEQVVKLIQAHPALLSYRVEERLQPFFAYLTGPAPEGLALSAQQAAEVVERRPTILGVEVDGLRRMVGFLLESGSSMEEVVEMMATSL